VDVVVQRLALEAVAGLAEERYDGLPGVAANYDDVLVRWIRVLDLGDEAGGTDDIEGGHTEHLLGIVDALALEDFGRDGNGAVDWVRDDEHGGVRAGVCGSFGEVADDGGVGVE
jgi:hypothetical protein